jgi:hypothetical protein
VLARKLITRGVKRLPVDQRERYLEEWLAHLGECWPTRSRKMVAHSRGIVPVRLNASKYGPLYPNFRLT